MGSKDAPSLLVALFSSKAKAKEAAAPLKAK